MGLGIGVPVGLVALLVAGPLAPELFAWCLAAVSALVLLHEISHAAVARLLSLEVHGLLFAASGGCCLAEEASSPEHELAYSSAGLACQLAVLVGSTLLLLGSLPPPQLRYGAAVFTAVNLVLLLANCWPANGSDGQRIVLAAKQLRAFARVRPGLSLERISTGMAPRGAQHRAASRAAMTVASARLKR